MRGFISELGGTILVVIAGIFVILMALLALIYFQLPFSGGLPSSQSIEFLAAESRGYSFAAVLSHFLAGDRQFIEQATEIMTTESDRNASAQYLSTYLRDLVASYKGDKPRLLILKIKKDDKEVFSYDTIIKKCGDNYEGFCVNSNMERERYVVSFGCGKGRKRIDLPLYTNEERKCRPPEICCVEDIVAGIDPPVYNGDVTMCGIPENGARKGVCDISLNGCLTGRIQIEDYDDQCSDAAGLICCRPLDAVSLVESGLASQADIPLAYRNMVGSVEVIIV